MASHRSPDSICRSRPEYIAAFYNVVDWTKVGEYYETAASGKPIEF
jgi:hypothetical protein